MRKVQALIVEDNEEKLASIQKEIIAFFDGDVDFEVCKSFSAATAQIFQKEFDLIVLDLLLPRRNGEKPVDNSAEVIEHIANSEKNRDATCVAISAFADVVNSRQSEFVKAGLLLIHYGPAAEWKACLQICMQRVASRMAYDFVILCALVTERDAFELVEHEAFSLEGFVNHGGLNGREMSIGDLRGVCVVQPQMGIVDAGIIAAKALECFSPSLLCMAGICGGFPDRTKLGRLVISDFSWDHQAGKWLGNEFQVRSFHENLKDDVKTCLSQLLEEDPELNWLQSKSKQHMIPLNGGQIGPSVSGSAVIASSEYAKRIVSEHGKVAAIDMEVYSVYRAAALHDRSLKCFAAKTVVDLANEEKGDDLQKAGAIISARFVVQAIDRLLS